MGYTTRFTGQFTITPALTPDQVAYLQAFAGSRRMKRNQNETMRLHDPVRGSARLPVGLEGGYYVGGAKDGNHGQTAGPDVVDSNSPPKGQPGLWCQWVPSPDGKKIAWDGGYEVFYYYQEWIRYLVENFLTPWGRQLNGKVRYQGEEKADKGTLVMVDNHLTVEKYIRKPKVAQKRKRNVKVESPQAQIQRGKTQAKALLNDAAKLLEENHSLREEVSWLRSRLKKVAEAMEDLKELGTLPRG